MGKVALRRHILRRGLCRSVEERVFGDAGETACRAVLVGERDERARQDGREKIGPEEDKLRLHHVSRFEDDDREGERCDRRGAEKMGTMIIARMGEEIILQVVAKQLLHVLMTIQRIGQNRNPTFGGIAVLVSSILRIIALC